MRVIIDGYEVEIKAKKESERFNKGETMEVINLIAILASEAEELYREHKKYDALADMADKISSNCHNVVAKNGGYNY